MKNFKVSVAIFGIEWRAMDYFFLLEFPAWPAPSWPFDSSFFLSFSWSAILSLENLILWKVVSHEIADFFWELRDSQ
jgi:hypothetical protein